jgi:hypothetical protein
MVIPASGTTLAKMIEAVDEHDVNWQINSSAFHQICMLLMPLEIRRRKSTNRPHLQPVRTHMLHHRTHQPRTHPSPTQAGIHLHMRQHHHHTIR